VLTLLTAVLCLTVSNAQQVQQKDPYLKTFIQDSKRLPDPQLQAELRDAQAWESFRETNGKWWVEFNEETGYATSCIWNTDCNNRCNSS
jgi:hypothetical protein